MVLQEKTSLLVKLGDFLLQGDESIALKLQEARNKNAWFTVDSSIKALQNIAKYFLNADLLNHMGKQISSRKPSRSEKNRSCFGWQYSSCRFL